MIKPKKTNSLPKVSIVVLNWNGFEDTAECVESLKAVTYPNLDILIVDNASTDGSAIRLEERFSGMKVIRTEENLGYAGGMNAGMREALASGTELITLLNNDTIVAPDFIDGLVRAASGDEKAGILSSRVYYYDQPGTIWYGGADINVWLGWGRHRGYNRKDGPAFSAASETGRPCGCSMMVTKRFCESVGLLDEELFCYFEDVDLGLRAKKSGFKVLYVPESKVWHKVARATGGAASALPLYYTVRNTLRSLDKTAPLPPILKQLRWSSIIVTSILSLFTMGVPKVLGVRRIFRGFTDYLNGRFGKLAS